MAVNNVQKYYEVVSKIVDRTGELIRNRIFAAKTIQTKASNIDFVTETDKEVECMIINGLKTEFPDHKFIGEETAAETNMPLVLTDEPTWIIDPVDGTLNFVHGNPHVCTSIGLYINKKPELGLIDVPIMKFRFTAMQGQGAKLNGKPIKVSGVKELSEALICLEGGNDPALQKRQSVIDNYSTFLPLVHGVRTYGSAAFSLAAVAMGATDMYMEYGPHIWDMAAGYVILQEAGGVLIDPAGGPIDLMSCRMLAASSPELAAEAASKFKQYYPKRDDA
ncbi:inositol monophosphatase [Nesidiocoris tenuis]|uniref:Inositol-1-monophosphatase n=1 Tax=Nesidiocoris tenuis TaxID=355587 RepID=A0ABN7AC43_9HEMI|nr:inositol monophosphatase [Nesidiocoris tenuis]